MTKLTDPEMIELLGGVTVVARMLDIKPPSVHAWIKEGIPDARLVALAAQIELKSSGRFSRREHWPVKYAVYWPELAQSAQGDEPGLIRSGADRRHVGPPIQCPVAEPVHGAE